MTDFPIVIRILLLAVWMVAVPFLAGGLLEGKMMRSFKLDGYVQRAVFRWCGGQMMLWAGFFLITVPLIIRESRFDRVVALFFFFSCLLAAGGIIRQLYIRYVKKVPRLTDAGRKMSAGEKVLWSVFGVLLGIQLLCTVFLAYEEGDDAYYVAVSAITNQSNTMYRDLPYTGGTSELDVRHGLAPMPIWIAFLARVTGLPAVSVAQAAAPVALIVMSYGVFYLIGCVLLGRTGVNCALFMTIWSLLVLFGGYSVYSAENFLLVRTTQGKAILGSIVLPFLLFLMMEFLKRLQEDEKQSGMYWLLMLAAVLAGCLCSTQGAVLIGLFIGAAGICAAAVYRRWRFLVPLCCCCIPVVCCLLLYVKLG